MRILVAAIALVMPAHIGANGQVTKPAEGLSRVIGEVTATDPATKQITIKTDANGLVSAILDEKTLYLRVPPGEKDLKKATKITLQDISVGDRVYVRGRLADDQKSIPAAAVMIMTKADLARKHERDRAEWQRRGIAGTVSALHPEAKEITISVRSREGPRPVVIEAGDNATFRRYAPDSVRFSDAKPSAFAELKVGDLVRVLGDQNDDGTRVKPEEIVFGSFRTIAGTIHTIDAAAGEIRITDLVTRKTITVRISADSLLRRLPPMMAAMMAQRRGAAAAGPSHPEPARAAGEQPPGEHGSLPPGMRRGGGWDPQEMLERMPPLPLAELKPGEAILISSTVGADPARVTAILLLAGVEPLMASAPQGQPIGGAWNFDIGMPQ